MRIKAFFRTLILTIAIVLGAAGCSKEEKETRTINRYLCYRQADMPTVATIVKDGKAYRPVHFIVLETSIENFYRYEVYNDDAVKYYGMTGLSTLPGYSGWYYDANAVKSISVKWEHSKCTLDDNTVLNWVVSDDNYITAFKDDKNTILYVAWKGDEDF